MTGRSEPTWPERLERHLTARPRTAVLTDQYDAGPMPRLNWFIENPKRGRAIAEWVAEWYRDGKVRSIHFVAHSNGCDIARRAINILTGEEEIPVDTAILISAPLADTTKGMRLTAALEDRLLRRLVCYVADQDAVLARQRTWRKPWTVLGSWARWPYGNLGRVGLQDAKQHLAGREGCVIEQTADRTFVGWGHSDFFPKERRYRMHETFELIEQDLNLPTE